MLNLSVLLSDAARETPDRDALVFGEMRISYALLDTVANQVANLLVAKGIQPGDKVALASPNLPYFPMVYFGILKAGAVVVPLNVLLKQREIAYHLKDSDATAFFCFEGTPELPLGEAGWAGFEQAEDCEHFILLPAAGLAATESPIEGAELFWTALNGKAGTFETVQTAPDDTAVIIYTSGTTGRPKGAELTHQSLLMNVMVDDNLFARSLHDTFMVTLPLFHIFGQTCVMNVGLYRRATLVLVPRFEPKPVVEMLVKEKVSLFAGVPTMYWALLSDDTAPEDVKTITESLRVSVSGGAALPLEVLKGIKRKFGVDVLEGYGLSETSPVASFNRVGNAKPGSIGFPIDGVEMRVVNADGDEVPCGESGEIVIRGHNVMRGYWKKPEETDGVFTDDWFHSGDVGRRDEDGFFYIVDRKKDMIIRGGFNVYPREIEEVLYEHPAVLEAAVIGVPHATHGEEVAAAVVLKPGTAAETDELRDYVKARVAPYKYPRQVWLVESLPKGPTGKILKREIRPPDGVR